MIKLEDLPEVTDRALNGLKANDILKTKILNTVIQKEKPYVYKKHLHLIPIVLSSVAVMVFMFVLLNNKKPLLSVDHHLIRSFTAGNSASYNNSFSSFSEIDLLSIKYFEISSTGKKNTPDQLNQLLDALVNHSILVKETDIVMTDHLNIFDSNGLLLSLPINSPYIGWSDGVRKCNCFFEMMEKASN